MCLKLNLWSVFIKQHKKTPKSLNYVVLKSLIKRMEIEFVEMQQQQILVMATSGAELFLLAKVLES